TIAQNGYYVTGQVGQATSGGTYTLTATATNLPGAPSLTSGTVTVNQPIITLSDHNAFLGVDLHRNFSISLSNPAPTGGLTISVASTDPTVASVLSPTVTVPAGQSYVYFEVDGLKPATTTITASAGGWTGDSASITTVNAVLQMSGPSSPVTTLTPSDSFTVYVYTPNCGYCDVVNAAAGESIGFSVGAGIVPTPANLTIAQNGYYVSGLVGQATSTGTYSLTATAAGLNGSPSITSGTVTVTAPYLSVSDNGSVVGAGLHRSFSVSLSNPAPTGGLPLVISGFASGTANVPSPSFTVAAGANYAYFEVDGIAAGTTGVTASASGWTSATSNFTVINPVLQMTGPSSPVTTLTPSDSFTVYVYTPGCGYCDVATAAVSVTPSINTTTPGIVPTPAGMTIAAGADYVSSSIGQPTTTGTFTLTLATSSLPGSPTITSPTITVN
ncbi:MAG TPA: hypothetical protein VNG93_01225, partial [Candidatus Dormibacteraeota bacterium]|nr:hypothetical protein [Candidatus Dormibacteraeota bacterium]